jgi:multimeric flavodoxin WrbA
MIVAVYGSPRSGGNTDILMDSFLSALETEEKIMHFKLRDMNLQPCMGCCRCDETGICIYKDDIQSIYECIEDAKGLILASPIYFACVTAQMKTFIDRGQAFWVRKFLLHQSTPLTTKKKGFYISAAAMNTDKYFINSRLVIRSFMISLDIEYSGELFIPCVEDKGEIRRFPEALNSAYQAGRNFLKQL